MYKDLDQRVEREKGIPVLKLPKKGADLLEGRQYYLCPIARATVKEEYGLVLPKTVECTRRKHPAREITTIAKNLETGEVKTTTMIDPAVSATFRCFISLNNIKVFTLDLEKIAALHQFYADSHKAAELELEELNEAKKSHTPRAKKSVAPIDIDALFASLGV
jgi:hypothetical protein